MAATLPPFSVLSAKSLVDPNKWDRIVSLLSRDILAICQANQKGFDASAAKTFLSSFFQDAARESLRNLSGHNEELSPSEDILFGRILDLFEKLATSNHSVDFALLQNLAITYGGKHRYLDRVQTMFSKALKSSPTILTEISFKVLPAYSSLLKPNLANDPSSTLSALRRTLYCITCLLRCGSIELCTTFARSMDFMMALATCYGRVLTGLATSLGGIRTHESNRELTWEIDFLEAKIDAMDAFHVLLSKGFLEFLKSSPHSSVEESFFSILLPLLDLDSAPNPPPSVIHFVNQPLLTDYEHAYRLSEMLRNTNPPMKDESMVDYVATALKATKVVGISDPPGGLSLLLVPRKSSPSHGSRVDKGKAKEIVRAHDIQIELAISQVLDILPDEDHAFIRECLRHPSFSGSAEKVIAAILEGTVPPELRDPKGIQRDKSSLMEGRSNPYNDLPMDFANLRQGKNRSQNADSILQDKSFVSQIKADILRRAQEVSSDEDDGRGDEMEDEVDDDWSVSSVLKVGNDGEDSEKSDDDVEEPAAQPSIDSILQQEYLKDPRTFDRDAATRRSKGRADLKAKTGWSDEQLEGWKIMLERNPNKDKILQQNEFAGNKAGPVERRPEAGPSTRGDRGHSRGGRGRGRGGGGRGGGGGGEGDTARDRAWKDKNKSRGANHNRKRGHDKKMARGGGPPMA